MTPLAKTTTSEQPPCPWMYVRLMRPGEHDHMLAIDGHLRKALSACDRCITIYVMTGLVPVSCHVCGAQRDETWLASLEDAARKQPQVRSARPAIATGNAFLRQIPGAQ